MENHIGLVKIQNDKLVAVQYFVSKFERELGDEINYNGKTYNVGVIADSRNAVIQQLNVFIKNQNRINRKASQSANVRVNQIFAEILSDCISDLNSNY